MMRGALVAVMALVLGLAQTAQAQEVVVDPPARRPVEAWVSLGAHLSLLADRLDRSTVNFRLGYALSAGARFRRWGVFGVLEHDLWIETEFDFGINRGVLNVGAGVEHFYFERRMRLALAGGTAVLLTNQPLDDRPSFGIFFEARPTGIRWSRSGWWVVQFDPIAIAIVAPVMRSPRIVDVQYRMTLAIEWRSTGRVPHRAPPSESPGSP